jgi:hypothetical protein
MRLGERYQVPNRPSHHVAIPLQEASAWLLRPQYSRDISRYGCFFGDDGDYTGLACWHLTVSILVVDKRPIESQQTHSQFDQRVDRQFGFGKKNTF